MSATIYAKINCQRDERVQRAAEIRNDGIDAMTNKPVKERRHMSLLNVIGGAVLGTIAFSSSLTGASRILSVLVFSRFD